MSASIRLSVPLQASVEGPLSAAHPHPRIIEVHQQRRLARPRLPNNERQSVVHAIEGRQGRFEGEEMVGEGGWLPNWAAKSALSLDFEPAHGRLVRKSAPVRQADRTIRQNPEIVSQRQPGDKRLCHRQKPDQFTQKLNP